tara:strand:+ start:330 stop:467 length:138 start_codon:yes stop_codon:yes gene_type:complete
MVRKTPKFFGWIGEPKDSSSIPMARFRVGKNKVINEHITFFKQVK